VSVIAHADPERQATGTFEVGAGFSSIEGFIARTRIEQSSLFGSGHTLALDARISRQREDFTLQYGTPDLGGGLSLSTELFTRSRDLPAFTRRGTGGALAMQQRFTPNLRGFIGYRFEEVIEPARTRISAVTAGLIHETPETTVGVAYEIADQRLGSSSSFDRLNAWVRHAKPVGPFTLRLGGTFTQLMGDVPRSELLFIDGASDLRGYAPGAIAPLGGTTKLTGRAELEVPLIRRLGISAVGFADAGGFVDHGIGTFGASAGVGLVWRSPIGTLRFDWAVPLDGGKPRFLFGIGGDW
jgi:outer membrane protein insertion porin family